MNRLQKLSSLIVPTNNAITKVFDFLRVTKDKRECITMLEAFEKKLEEGPALDMPPNHYFGKDVYVKELLFKKGTVATGMVQKVEHVSILISGEMTLWTPEKGLHRVVGPSITEVKPGMKRAGYAHTDVLWACAYGVRDAESYCASELLEMLTFRYYAEYEEFEKKINAGDLLKEYHG
jgi:hypothetical protein